MQKLIKFQVEFTIIFVKLTGILVICGDSGVLLGARNGEKCKMTHYYCAKTTLGHLIVPPKSTPELVKWHKKSTQKCQIPLILGEIHQNLGGIHRNFGDFG